MVEKIGGAKSHAQNRWRSEIANTSKQIIYGSFGAMKKIFSAQRTKLIGGGETQFRPPIGCLDEGGHGPLALPLMSTLGHMLFFGRKWQSLIKSSFVQD